MKSKLWTEDEINYLEEQWGTKSIKTIGVKLNRTVDAVKNKAYEIGLRSFLNQGEYITFHQLIKTMGYTGGYKHLEERLLKVNFPMKYKKVINRRYKIVYLKDFWRWVEKHKQDISFAKFEKGTLGEEPKWVDEKRKADLSNPSKLKHNRKWTKAEDSLLIAKTKSCRYTYKDLAKEFNRTEAAIKRRLYDLAVPYRPIPLDTHIKWTDEENKKMFELYEKGYDTYAIAQALNKTHLSISDRLKKVVI